LCLRRDRRGTVRGVHRYPGPAAGRPVRADLHRRVPVPGGMGPVDRRPGGDPAAAPPPARRPGGPGQVPAPAHRRDDRQPDPPDPRRGDPRHLGRAGSTHPPIAGHRAPRPRRRVGDPAVQQHPVTAGLNPARLAYFTDWITTLPPRPLPRTVTPLAGEYHHDYIARLAEANHLVLAELAHALDDPAAITVHGPLGWKQHEQERLAAAASQPLPRIARLCWPDPRSYLRDPEGFHRMLRPACRRCAARYGITGP